MVERENMDMDYFGRNVGDVSKDNPLNQDGIGENEILAVSVGTSCKDSRISDIKGIEEALQKANPDWSVRRAFTSQMITERVREREGVRIDNMEQALARAVANGVKNLVIQPTHLMRGIEYDELAESVEAYQDKFKTISVAEPLLGEEGAAAAVTNAGKEAVAKAIIAEAVKGAGYDLLKAAKEDGAAFVFLGHGTSHTVKASYCQMQTQMNKLRYDNAFIGTIEGEPEETSLKAVMEAVAKAGYQKVILRPFMVAAGYHVNHALAGDREDSWLSTFRASGKFDSVEVQLRGLGSIEAIQQIYVEHTKTAMKKVVHEKWRPNSYRFFENKECQYFPCHSGIKELNCLFCYCPLYGKENCPGNPEYMEKEGRKIKVCTGCIFPHQPESYDKVVQMLKPEKKIKAGIDNQYHSAGIDGCKGGWMIAVICNGALSLQKAASFMEAVDGLSFDACLVDMVIGLQGNERQIRPDSMARKILKGRASTVFPAPCRKAVYGETKEERLQANVEVLHKKFTSQTDAMIPKMREVDEFLQEHPQFKNRIQESHPEVCFARLKGKALMTSKHDAEGIRERAKVIAEYFPEVTESWVITMAKQMKCKEDDITDSVCLAITANLLAQGEAETIPKEPMKDDTGLKMQMIIPKGV